MMKFLKTALVGLMLALPLTSVQAVAGDQVIYLVRHAEKDRSDPENRNPHLTEKGQARAAWLAGYFADKNLKAIYSTNYNRTKETAAPTAAAAGLTVMVYDPRDLKAAAATARAVDGNVLIVGHSNTTNYATNILAGTEFGEIDDSDNSQIYVVTFDGDKATVRIDKSKAGE